MREFLGKDLGWKLFSLGLAITLYFTVRTVRQSGGEVGRAPEPRAVHSYRNVPVQPVSAAGDVSAYRVRPSGVEITVRSRPEIINQLRPAELRATVDLTGLDPARGLRRRVAVAVPPGVTLVEVRPAEVMVVPPAGN